MNSAERRKFKRRIVKVLSNRNDLMYQYECLQFIKIVENIDTNALLIKVASADPMTLRTFNGFENLKSSKVYEELYCKLLPLKSIYTYKDGKLTSILKEI